MHKKTDIKVRRRKIYVIGGVLLFVLAGLFSADKITRQISDNNLQTYRNAVSTQDLAMCERISGFIRYTPGAPVKTVRMGDGSGRTPFSGVTIMEGGPSFPAMSQQEARERCRERINKN